MSSEVEIQFYRSGEWTGVYLNGELVRHGDHYLADEWLRDRCGVKVVDSDYWLLDGRHPLATLKDVAAHTSRCERLYEMVQDMRHRAANLTAEAERLEGKIKGTRA